jgi:hypothetical protein
MKPTNSLKFFKQPRTKGYFILNFFITFEEEAITTSKNHPTLVHTTYPFPVCISRLDALNFQISTSSPNFIKTCRYWFFLVYLKIDHRSLAIFRSL